MVYNKYTRWILCTRTTQEPIRFRFMYPKCVCFYQGKGIRTGWLKNHQCIILMKSQPGFPHASTNFKVSMSRGSTNQPGPVKAWELGSNHFSWSTDKLQITIFDSNFPWVYSTNPSLSLKGRKGSPIIYNFTIEFVPKKFPPRNRRLICTLNMGSRTWFRFWQDICKIQ